MNFRYILAHGLFLFALALSGCVETTAPTINSNDVGSTYFVQVNALNLRKCATTKCEIVAVLNQGTPVKIQTMRNGWLEVQVRNSRKTGWVSAKYVSAKQPPMNGAKAASTRGVPELPEEEFAPATPEDAGPQVTEEFAPAVDADKQGAPAAPPPVQEQFAE